MGASVRLSYIGMAVKGLHSATTGRSPAAALGLRSGRLRCLRRPQGAWELRQCGGQRAQPLLVC
jgi:hypothetical protein